MISVSQQLGGGFETVIRLNNDSRKDVNSCITSLVLRELQKRPGLAPPNVINKAFDFLSSCASSSTKGAYNFYPSEHNAQNISVPSKITVPDDADDTALITLLLLQTGRITRNSIIRDTCIVLDKYRLPAVGNRDPHWFKAGAFYTWLEAGRNNMMDCCVNANIVALYAYAGLQHLRGHKEACRLISNAVNWCGRSATRLASIMPFYADKQELFYAVEHAVRMGAAELTPVLKKLEWANPKNEQFDADRSVCCSAYGKITWHCSLLQRLRNHSS
ncbi:hypothetical protein [Flavitalea sp.]|nr:hypothetical protein [Flavitalea sp.]